MNGGTRGKDLFQGGPLPLMMLKELVTSDPNVKGKLNFSAKAIVPVGNSKDIVEAVRALIEKRKPEWKLE